jgi:hypothetical protein
MYNTVALRVKHTIYEKPIKLSLSFCSVEGDFSPGRFIWIDRKQIFRKNATRRIFKKRFVLRRSMCILTHIRRDMYFYIRRGLMLNGGICRNTLHRNLRLSKNTYLLVAIIASAISYSKIFIFTKLISNMFFFVYICPRLDTLYL